MNIVFHCQFECYQSVKMGQVFKDIFSDLKSWFNKIFSKRKRHKNSKPIQNNISNKQQNIYFENNDQNN